MCGAPLVFDYLHHALCPGGLSERQALEAALGTWPAGVRPVVHYRCARRGAAVGWAKGWGLQWRARLGQHARAPRALQAGPLLHLSLLPPRSPLPNLHPCPRAPPLLLLSSESSEDPTVARRAHSRMLTQPFDLHGHEAEVDVMLEAKGMEQALLFYRWAGIGGQAGGWAVRGPRRVRWWDLGGSAGANRGLACSARRPGMRMAGGCTHPLGANNACAYTARPDECCTCRPPALQGRAAAGAQDDDGCARFRRSPPPAGALSPVAELAGASVQSSS